MRASDDSRSLAKRERERTPANAYITDSKTSIVVACATQHRRTREKQSPECTGKPNTQRSSLQIPLTSLCINVKSQIENLCSGLPSTQRNPEQWRKVYVATSSESTIELSTAAIGSRMSGRPIGGVGGRSIICPKLWWWCSLLCAFFLPGWAHIWFLRFGKFPHSHFPLHHQLNHWLPVCCSRGCVDKRVHDILIT